MNERGLSLAMTDGTILVEQRRDIVAEGDAFLSETREPTGRDTRDLNDENNKTRWHDSLSSVVRQRDYLSGPLSLVHGGEG